MRNLALSIIVVGALLGLAVMQYSFLRVAIQLEKVRFDQEAGLVLLLTEREAQLLRLLCLHKGRLLPRQKVLKALWNQNDYFTRRSMDAFISRLRKYLAADPDIEILNVYGSGFILRDGGGSE